MPSTLQAEGATAASDLPPELQVLLSSSATGRDFSGLPPHLDWDALVRMAKAHGLVPQVSHALRAWPTGQVPMTVVHALEEHQRAIVQRGLRLTAALLEVHHALTAAGLSALPYKGPTLSLQLYGDPALRDAVDLDVLVPQEQMPAATEAMAQVGFVPARRYPPAIRGQLLRYRAEIGLVRADVLLELQWRLAPKYFSVEIDFGRFWERRSEVTLRERKLPVLSAEDNLLVLCVHGAKHHWHALKWLVDVDHLIQTNAALDWKTALERAKALGVRRIVYTALCLCVVLLKTPLPEWISEQIEEDAAACKMAAEVGAALATSAVPSEAQHHRFQLALRERRLDRWRYLSRLAWQPTESEWDSLHLPRGLAWLYPVVRLGRVAAKAMG